MFELVNKKRNGLKKNKKGFTLVEVIVVLVILAILAAILVPTMTGWIRKANEKTIIAEARTAQIAIQTIVSENYNTPGAIDTNNHLVVDPYLNEAAEIGEFDVDDIQGQTVTVNANRQISYTYVGDGYTISCTNGVLDREPTEIE